MTPTKPMSTLNAFQNFKILKTKKTKTKKKTHKETWSFL